MHMTAEDLRAYVGRELVDKGGEKSGKVESIFFDTSTNEPAWLAVHRGLFGHHTTLVPIEGAEPSGDVVKVPFDKETIKNAPEVDGDRPIDSKEATQLMEHYGLVAEEPRNAPAPTSTSSTTSTDRATSSADRATSSTAKSTSARGRGAATAGEAMTRSEEELFVGTETEEIGHVRLRKWIETEPIARTVTVTHEEARIVREPITDENMDQAMSGPELTESEHEVVLHEERPVVEKRVVPKERIRLETEKIAEQQEIRDELRKERVELEKD